MSSDEPLGVPLDVDVVFRLITLESVDYDLQTPSPRLHFQEIEGDRRTFTMPLGVPEATALSLALAGVPARRPSSSELATTLLTTLGVDVIAVRIVRYDAGVFFAELDLMTPKGRRVIDCRPSDAFAIGLRHPSGAPFLIDETILQQLAEKAD
jgi:hypothetical protein